MPQFQLRRLSRTDVAARRARRRPPVRPLVRALALAGLVSTLGVGGLPPAAAQGLPSGMNVVHGQATAVVDGSRMTVTNSANAVLNWQAFSVGTGQQVRFEQPGATSRVLNRVVGSDASQIFGSISSNGQVWLLNPHGVLFGREARVDVGSLVVSTLGLPLADWTGGRGPLSLTAPGAPGAAPIVNQGELRAASGGRIWLVGGDGGVRNEGLIAAPDGQVVLAAGRNVDLVDERLPNVAVRIGAPGAEVRNLGSLAAGGGRIDLLAAIVNQGGIVRADSIAPGRGEVRIAATESLQLAAGSLTSASGADGGRVLLDAGPAGTLLSAGTVQATGSAGRGGEVQMLGRHVGLSDAAVVDASGGSGGGAVFVGGGVQGQDASLRNAEAVYFGPTATVRADATDNGDGGHIVLWSDQATRAYGHLSARGGMAGGDGGFIETSGGWLDARPASVRTDAPAGQTGQWLLDPFDIHIVGGELDTGITAGPVFTPTANDAQLSTLTLSTALANTNVTVTTDARDGNNLPIGTQSGDIVMNDVLLGLTVAAPRTLTFNANQDIRFIDSQIRAVYSTGATADALLTVNLNAGRDVLLDYTSIFSLGGPLTARVDAGRNVTLRGTSAIYAGFGALTASLLARGGNVVLEAVSELTPALYASQGPATVTFAAPAGAITIGGSSIFANGPLSFTASAAGDITVNASNIFTGDTGPITVDLDAGGNVGINDSFIFSVEGPLSVTLGAAGTVGLTNSDVFSTDGSLSMTVDAGLDFSLDASQLWVEYFDVPLGSSLSLTATAQRDILLRNASSIESFDGPMSVSLSAPRGDIEIASTSIGFSDPGQPLVLQARAGGNLTLLGANIWGEGKPSFATFEAGGTLEIDLDTSIYFTGDDGVTLSAPTLRSGFDSFAVSSDGPVRILTDDFANSGPMSITSYAGGTSIVIAGHGGGNVTTFVNADTIDLFDNGEVARWLVYLADDTYTGAGLTPHDFRQYGMTYATEPTDGRNGLVYALPAVLTVSNTAPITKVYDGTATVTTQPSLAVSGLRPGHTITAGGDVATAVVGAYAGPNVGTGIPIAVTGVVPPTVVVGGGAAAAPIPVYGYAVAYDVRGDITRRLLTLSGVAAADKVYDGTRDAQLSGGTLANLVAGQTLTLTLTDGLFDTANVGTDKLVTGTAALANGSGLASNYQLAGGGAVTTTAAVTPRPLTLSGVAAADKVYDGTRSATLSGGSLSNLVSGESLGVSLSAGLFDTPNSGTDKLVTGTAALTDGSGQRSNYALVGGGAIATTADITPRPLTLSGVQASDKVYDGTRDATLSGGSLGNLVAGETLAFTLTGGLFDTAHVGTAKPVTGAAVLSNGSGLASNYTLAGTAVDTTADVTPRPLTLSGVVAVDKVYDGTRAAQFAGGSLANLVAGESLGIAVPDGLFDTASVGTGKAVTGTASLVDGSGRASNYELVAGAAISTTGAIDPRPLTLSGVTAADKVYDGQRETLLSGGTLVNLVAGETLGLTLSGGLFDNANAGVGKPVSGAAALTNGTGLVSNYVLANGGVATATATIEPRPLTLSGVTASDKVYDGTRGATLAGGNLANLVGSETLALALADGLFDTPDAGVGKPVTGTVVLVDGTGLAANYTLAGAGTVATTASIAPRPLTVSGVVAADKVYDGNRDTVLSGGSLQNLVAGETLALVYGPGLFDTPHAGTGKPVSGTASLGDGSGRVSNYRLVDGGALATTASIGPRPVALSGVVAADKVYDGTRTAALSGGQLADLVPGETLGVVLSGGLFDTAGAGRDKPVSGSAALADGSGRASNYALSNTAVATTADVSPALLQYLADAVTVLQGQPIPALTGQVSGFVGGETLAEATSGSLGFATPATAQSLPGSYAIDGFGLTALNYTLVQAPGNAYAMSVAAPPPREGAAELAAVFEGLRTDPLLPLAPAGGPATMRALDALQGLRTDSRWGSAFGSIDIDAYSRDALAVLLESRSAYKRSLFDAAMKRLEADPTLADLPPCQSEDEVETGRCLVTDGLIAQAGAAEKPDAPTAPVVGLAPPVAAPTSTPKPAAPPAPAPVPPAAPVAAVAPPVPAAAPAAVPPAPAPAMPIAVAVARPKTVAMAKAPPMPMPRAVRAAALPQIQRKVAVLIGLDNYVDERIPLLENAGRDVEAVARVLESQLGYQTVVVRDASREAIVGVLNKLALTARPNDSVVIYYAGHGTVVEGTGLGYWIPASANAERPESWISNNDIGKLVGRIRASQVVLISDSCFSGSLVSERRVQVFGGADDPGALLQRRAAVVMSSGGDEPVADGARNGHSPFAASLMQSLSQLDNWRPGNTVFEQVRQDVTRRLPQTPHYGAARQGRHVEGADYVFEERQLEQALR